MGGLEFQNFVWGVSKFAGEGGRLNGMIEDEVYKRAGRLKPLGVSVITSSLGRMGGSKECFRVLEDRFRGNVKYYTGQYVSNTLSGFANAKYELDREVVEEVEAVVVKNVGDRDWIGVREIKDVMWAFLPTNMDGGEEFKNAILGGEGRE